MFKISQTVIGGVAFSGRRISITPSEFGLQIAVVHTAALAGAVIATLNFCKESQKINLE